MKSRETTKTIKMNLREALRVTEKVVETEDRRRKNSI